MEISGWGRYPRFEAAVLEPGSPLDVKRLLPDLTGYIPRGNGRAYGDAAIGMTTCLSLR